MLYDDDDVTYACTLKNCRRGFKVSVNGLHYHPRSSYMVVNNEKKRKEVHVAVLDRDKGVYVNTDNGYYSRFFLIRGGAA